MPGEFKELLQELRARWARVHEMIDACDARIAAHARDDKRCVRLRAIIGIGPITADVAVTKIGSAHEFRNARQLAALLHLVPTQHSCAGQTRLRTSSCRGDTYLRTLLIQAARSSLQRAKAVSIENATTEQLWIREKVRADP